MNNVFVHTDRGSQCRPLYQCFELLKDRSNKIAGHPHLNTYLLQYLINQTKKIGLETNTECLDVVIVNEIIQQYYLYINLENYATSAR